MIGIMSFQNSAHTSPKTSSDKITPWITRRENMYTYRQFSHALPDCVKIWYTGALSLRASSLKPRATSATSGGLNLQCVAILALLDVAVTLTKLWLIDRESDLLYIMRDIAVCVCVLISEDSSPCSRHFHFICTFLRIIRASVVQTTVFLHGDNMPYLTMRIQYNLAVMAYKVLHGRAPSYLGPLVASYNIQPKNGVDLFWDTHARAQTHRYLLTYLLTYLFRTHTWWHVEWTSREYLLLKLLKVNLYQVTLGKLSEAAALVCFSWDANALQDTVNNWTSSLELSGWHCHGDES